MKPGHLQIQGDQFVITCQPHVAIRLRRLFGGAQRAKAGVFKMAAIPAHAYDLEWFRQRHPMEIEPGSAAAFRRLVAAHERRLASIAEVEAVDYVPREFSLAIPPREYQRVAGDLALRTGGLLIADDVGVGKTVSAICTFTAPKTLPALVVTMTHLPRQWERELARFAPDLRVHRLRKGTPYKFSDVKFETDPDGKRRKVDYAKHPPDVIITNYHKLDGWVETLSSFVRTVVYDEVQELRISGSIKSNAAAAISQVVKLRIGLSATPVYNYGAEIFAVLEMIRPGSLGTWAEFCSEWCGGRLADDDARDRNKVCVTEPAALGAYLRETGLMIRRTRKDVGRDLPALTVVRHVVEVDPARINEATAHVAELAQRVLDRAGTGVELMRWSGEIDWRMRQATGIGKAPAVADFVRLLVDAGEQVVLFGWHREVYSIWQDAFSRKGYEIPFAMYTGEESETQKVESVRRFVAREVRVLILSLRSGAGLDGLQFVSRTVVNGELDWSPAVHHQNNGRVHRDGQTDPVMSYYLVAEEGSDPVIEDVLGLKEAQAQGIRDPDAVGSPQLVGASGDHIRRLAEDVLRRHPRASDHSRTVGDDARDRDSEAAPETPELANGNDDPGGAGHRGGPGAPLEDAGVQLRDQRDAVPHGEQAP